MDEKKKIIFMIAGMIAGLVFLITNFCRPIARDNVSLLDRYKQLKAEVTAMKDFSLDEIEGWDKMLSTAASDLRSRFLGEGKAKLTEQLTKGSKDLGMTFAEIAQREPEEKDGYQAVPIDITMKAQLYDLIKYLADIESGSLLIGVNSISIRRLSPQDKNLDIKAVFHGFRSTVKPPPASIYQEQKYQPFDEQRLKMLLVSVGSRTNFSSSNLNPKLYNPFFSAYDVVGLDDGRAIKLQTIDNLSLQGTMHIAGKKVALINGAVVREGEKVSGMEVIEIGNGRVLLFGSGKKYILKMGVDDELIKP